MSPSFFFFHLVLALISFSFYSSKNKVCLSVCLSVSLSLTHTHTHTHTSFCCLLQQPHRWCLEPVGAGAEVPTTNRTLFCFFFPSLYAQNISQITSSHICFFNYSRTGTGSDNQAKLGFVFVLFLVFNISHIAAKIRGEKSCLQRRKTNKQINQKQNKLPRDLLIITAAHRRDRKSQPNKASIKCTFFSTAFFEVLIFT